MKNEITDILREAIKCFQSARQKVAEGMKYLYEISEKELWNNGEYNSFAEFCETGCGISKGFASKLLTVYKHYVIEGKVSQRNLSEVDPEKLYLAVSLPGSHDKQLVKAETWTREELRDELASGDDGDCKHENIIKICTRCKKRVE